MLDDRIESSSRRSIPVKRFHRPNRCGNSINFAKQAVPARREEASAKWTNRNVNLISLRFGVEYRRRASPRPPLPFQIIETYRRQFFLDRLSSDCGSNTGRRKTRDHPLEFSRSLIFSRWKYTASHNNGITEAINKFAWLSYIGDVV